MCNVVVNIKQFRELVWLACVTAVCWMRNPRWRRTPIKCWLSFEEIRARLKVGPGTPSLKHPAKTIAPGLGSLKPGSREAMQEEAADETERLRPERGYGVASPSSAI
jgi:hypothetical protein